jgi:hypothetical protein
VGNDLRESEFAKPKRTRSLDHRGHDATTPKWLGDPIANFGAVGLADLNALISDTTD